MVEELADTIKEIVLTDEGKRPQKELVFITDMELAHVLDDPARLQILTVLKKGVPDTLTTTFKDEQSGDTIIRQREVERHALSVVEIVKLSGTLDHAEEVTKNQVYHHLPKLIENGYVVKYGTVTTGDRTTDYYRRTAKGFVIAAAETKPDSKEHRAETLKFMQRMSTVFDIKLSDEDITKMTELVMRAKDLSLEGRKKIASLVKGDIVDPDALEMYDSLLQIYLHDNQEYMAVMTEMKRILFP